MALVVMGAGSTPDGSMAKPLRAASRAARRRPRDDAPAQSARQRRQLSAGAGAKQQTWGGRTELNDLPMLPGPFSVRTHVLSFFCHNTLHATKQQ